MSLQSRYKWINIVRFVKGEFSAPSRYDVVGKFKGLIQVPSNSNTFNNGKDTSNVVGVLFCSNKQTFESKDLIESNGKRYKIAGSNTQIDGVCGLEPIAGQHAEYQLEYAQEGL